MRRQSLWTKIFLGLVAFSILGTLLTTLTGLNPGPIKPTASIFTIAAGVIALAAYVKPWRIAAVVTLGAGTEIIGLYTGLPFGRYAYTDAWWPTVPLPGDHRFPLLLPFAWFLLAGGCALALQPLYNKAGLIAGPLAATLIDLFMEPVMTGKLGYWHWLDKGPLPGGAPWMNLFGWLLTSFLAAVILWRERVHDPGPVWVVWGYIALVAGLWVAG